MTKQELNKLQKYYDDDNIYEWINHVAALNNKYDYKIKNQELTALWYVQLFCLSADNDNFSEMAAANECWYTLIDDIHTKMNVWTDGGIYQQKED